MPPTVTRTPRWQERSLGLCRGPAAPARRPGCALTSSATPGQVQRLPCAPRAQEATFVPYDCQRSPLRFLTVGTPRSRWGAGDKAQAGPRNGSLRL